MGATGTVLAFDWPPQVGTVILSTAQVAHPAMLLPDASARLNALIVLLMNFLRGILHRKSTGVKGYRTDAPHDDEIVWTQAADLRAIEPTNDA